MFRRDAVNIASRLLSTKLPKWNDQVIRNFIALPKDGAWNFLEALFEVPRGRIVELKQLRDNFVYYR